jgi:hypothetical protein
MVNRSGSGPYRTPGPRTCSLISCLLSSPPTSAPAHVAWPVHWGLKPRVGRGRTRCRRFAAGPTSTGTAQRSRVARRATGPAPTTGRTGRSGSAERSHLRPVSDDALTRAITPESGSPGDAGVLGRGLPFMEAQRRLVAPTRKLPEPMTSSSRSIRPSRLHDRHQPSERAQPPAASMARRSEARTPV